NESLRQNAFLIPTVDEIIGPLSTDSRYQLKITVNPPPKPSSGHASSLADKIYCFGRLYPGTSPEPYSALKFTVALRYLKADNTLGSYVSRNGTKIISNPVPIGSSIVVDFSNDRPISSKPFVFSIEDVRAPDDGLGSYACWGMTVEIFTDGSIP